MSHSNTERETIEQSLFTWEGWQDDGPFTLAFDGVTLVKQIGEFPVGTKFQAAFLLGERSLLVLIDEKNTEHVFEMGLNVGSKLETITHNQHESACDCGHDHG